MKKLFIEKQVAALLEVSVKTLQGWRLKGGGPPFAKMGRLIRYAESDLEAFVLEKRRTSTSDSGQRPAYKLPAMFTDVTSQKKSWTDLPPGPSVAAAPRPKAIQFARLPTRRLHGTIRVRIRTIPVLPNQLVERLAPRPAR